MDAADRKILACLQEDATMPLSEISKRVGLSSTPVLAAHPEARGNRRHPRQGRPAGAHQAQCRRDGVRVDPHQPPDIAWLDEFAKAWSNFPQVVEFYRMSGDIDYLLRVWCPTSAPTMSCTNG